MWTFTGYILWKLYHSGRRRVDIDELVRLIFGRLWREGVVLSGSLAELRAELEYLAGLGYVELNRDAAEIALKDALRGFDLVVGKSELRKMSGLYNEYVEKIDAVVAEITGASSAGKQSLETRSHHQEGEGVRIV